MKKFSFALLLISVISLSFVVASKAPTATPVQFDDDRTGSSTFYNLCTGETVNVTFRSRYSVRGVINGQKISFKIHFNEQQEGIGQTTGTKYMGSVNSSENQNVNMVNGLYVYSSKVSVRMVAPGNGNNFKSNMNIGYSITSSGDVSFSRDELVSECH